MPIIIDLPEGGPGSPATGRTFLELQNEVLAHGFAEARYRTRVKAWLNDGLYRIARSVKLAELEFETSIVTVPGQAAYALPGQVRIISLRDEQTDSRLTDVPPDVYDDLGEDAGTARAFSVYGSSVHFYPVPNDARTLTLRYRSSAETMVEDGDIPSMPAEYSDILVSYALAKAFAAEDDMEAAAFHRAEYERELSIMRSDVQYGAEGRRRQVPGMVRGSGRLTFQRPV